MRKPSGTKLGGAMQKRYNSTKADKHPLEKEKKKLNHHRTSHEDRRRRRLNSKDADMPAKGWKLPKFGSYHSKQNSSKLK
jgi:hypothetical protein